MHTQQTATGMYLVSPSCEAWLAPPYAFKQLPAMQKVQEKRF